MNENLEDLIKEMNEQPQPEACNLENPEDCEACGS